MIKDHIIYTPPLRDGGVAGIMRHQIMERLPGMGYEIKELSIHPSDIEQADEIFLSNALYGIRWVGMCGNKSFTNHIIQKIYRDLLQTSPALFC